jgi:hypothetical protein
MFLSNFVDFQRTTHYYMPEDRTLQLTVIPVSRLTRNLLLKTFKIFKLHVGRLTNRNK